MMTKLELVILVLLLSPACSFNSNTTGDTSIAKGEVKKLHTLEDRENYLLYLFDEDQKMRQGASADIILKYGTQSPEMREFTQKVMALDALNLQRVETYLDEFGYPDHSEHGDLANAAIPAVIHHCDSYEDRERLLPILHDAYKRDLIGIDPILMILNRMHRMKFGKHLEWEGTFRPEEELERFSMSLGLRLHEEITNS